MNIPYGELDREQLGILCHLVSGEKHRSMRMLHRATHGNREAQQEAVSFFTDSSTETAERYLKSLESMHRILSRAYEDSIDANSDG